MAFRFDPQVQAALALLVAEGDRPTVGDVMTRRARSRQLSGQLVAALPAVEGVEVDRYSTIADDGATISLSWYHRADVTGPGSAVLYAHGGGMIFGMDELGGLYDAAVRGYVAASGVPMLVVDYRVAPEFPHPVPVEDCYAALVWLASHGTSLGVDSERLAVMGDSAGGGLAAGVSLLARDRGGPRVAQQLLIYPMLDDRTATPDAKLLPFATWTYDDNVTGWQALLGGQAGTGETSPYAAPARAADLANLPDTYIDVGDIDIFRDESIAFAGRLVDAGIPTELHLYQGCPHAFEWMAPNAQVSQRALGDRIRRLRSL
ncbi:alpha/beta hydrolase [Mycobacterium sp.]|uniref:alpha/beta hydrolase n=1 Tax=Mycobacterium sp. TaxID=1785 RepID=UPI003BABF184